jgi:XTP/dITP diphosphohydrolase
MAPGHAETKTLLYATTNPGKVLEVRKYLQSYGIPLVAPAELGLTIAVEETGQTLEENAILKAQAYRDHAPHLLVLADDTGVEIDALNGEPGIHVRRWKDHTTPMSDQAIIDYCLERLHHVPSTQRGAQLRTVLALRLPDGSMELFEGRLRGVITETPAPLTIPGFPFETLFYVPEWDKLLGDVHTLSIDAKLQQGYLTHRERALHQAIPRLQALLSNSQPG